MSLYVVMVLPIAPGKVRRIPIEKIEARTALRARAEISSRYGVIGMQGTLSMTRWQAARLGARLIRTAGVTLRRPRRGRYYPVDKA